MSLLAPSTPQVDALSFELDELRGAIATQPVVEILRAVAFRPIAGQPPFVPGVINLRGTVVPLVDLRVRFGRPARPLAPEHYFIVVKTHHRPVALWVDRVLNIISFDPSALVGAEGLVVGTRSFAGILRTRDGFIVLHDPAAFITEAELDAVCDGWHLQ